MNSSSIQVLQLCHLAGATRAQAQAILHHSRQFATQDEGEFRVSTVFVTTRRDRADDLIHLASGLGIDVHELHQHGPVDPTVWWRLRRLIRRLAVQLVHAHDSKSYRLALLLQPFCGFRMVASAEHSSADDWKKWIAREVDRKLLPGFDRVIAANDQLAWQLSQLGCRARQIDVIHKGVDTETFSRRAVAGDWRAESGVPPEAFAVGAHASCGELQMRRIFDAVQLAEATMGPIHLLWLGDEPAAACAERLAVESRRSERTRWLGIRGSQPEVYAAMDLFIAASSETGPSSELLEAQSMEVPAICLRSRATQQWIEQGTTGLLVDPDRSDMLAQGIVQLLQNRGEAELMASAGRLRICQQFRNSERHKHVATTYRRAIEQR